MSPSREALLAAADELLGERPWSKVSLGAVAARAGVSRQTLYNEFGGRREFAQAFVLREADRLLAGPEAELARHAPDPRAGVEAALAVFLESAQDNRLLAAMREEEDNGLLALITTRGAVIDFAAERLHAHVLELWPGVDPDGARRLMDVVVRLGISHSNLPGSTPTRTAADLAAVLGPYAEALLPSALTRAA